MNNKILIQTEKKIRKGIYLIKNKKQSPKEAKLGKLLNSLKNIDEPLYDELISLYKIAIKLYNND